MRALRATAALVLIASCNQLQPIETEESTATVPTRVQDALDLSCALGGCHDAGSRAGGLSLAARDSASIIDGASTQSPLPLVTLGDVQGSYLAVKVLPDENLPEGVTREGARMPLGGPTDSPEVAILLGWIAGAELPGGAVDDEPGGASGAESSGGVDDDGADADASDDETGGTDDQVVACGLRDVAPSVDLDAAVEVGEGASVLPASIGAAIEANCGCHLAVGEELVPDAPSYGGALRMATFADFHADFGGAPAYEAIRARVDGGSMPPLYYCSESAVDVSALAQWLAAGAPDAAEFDP